MRKIRAILLLACLLCVLGMAGPSRARPSAQYAVSWNVVSTGGAPMHSDSYDADSSAAQVASGLSRSTSYSLCTGYWCGVTMEHVIYLPLLMRNVST